MIAKNILRIDEFQNLSKIILLVVHLVIHIIITVIIIKNNGGDGSSGSSMAALKYTPKIF